MLKKPAAKSIRNFIQVKKAFVRNITFPKTIISMSIVVRFATKETTATLDPSFKNALNVLLHSAELRW